MATSRVARRASVPVLDPLDAWRRLEAAGRRPWLFLSAGAHPEARRSVVAFDPVAEVVARGGEAVWTDAEGTGALPPLDALARLDAMVRDGGEAGFTGGLVGWLGFEAARWWEPGLPTPPPGDGPDAVLRVCTGAYVVDHATNTATLHANALSGDDDAAAAALATAQDTLATPDGPTTGQAPASTAWETSLNQGAFEDAVRRVKGLVATGDLFQANIATRFRTRTPLAPDRLLAALREANPSPYMALLPAADVTIVSGSPEQLFAVEDGRIRTRPIAGTRRRDPDPAVDEAMEQELRGDAKEQAEHTMLVDLLRNDVARVARPGTVRVAEWASVERYRHVMHLVSRVEGDLRAATGLADWLAALFPGGTVTGAPKLRATQRIMEVEPARRGPYTGSAGWMGWGGDAAWNILIRTLVLRGGVADVHAGSGIVADSDPAREWHEAGHKAQALLEAATGHDRGGGNHDRIGTVSPHGAWAPPAATPRHSDRRVLLVDNEDSFVHNLADYCAALGATTRVVRSDGPVDDALASWRPTHVILSPGPGHPADAGATPRLARELVGRLPVLGVCLGHQALGLAHGGAVGTGPPIHGKPDSIHHDGGGLFRGLPSPLRATRYHSLHVAPDPVPAGFVVDARLTNGTVMALRHKECPVFGLQFHPESLCTEHGLDILDRFLETT